MVKNSLTGPPPSMAGSPEKVFFIGTVKSNFLCLKKAILSSKMESLQNVKHCGAPGRGVTL
jgi:hypothetical protein